MRLFLLSALLLVRVGARTAQCQRRAVKVTSAVREAATRVAAAAAAHRRRAQLTMGGSTQVCQWRTSTLRWRLRRRRRRCHRRRSARSTVWTTTQTRRTCYYRSRCSEVEACEGIGPCRAARRVRGARCDPLVAVAPVGHLLNKDELRAPH